MTSVVSAGAPGTDSGPSALIDGVDVDAVAAAVKSCAGVDDLYSTPAATMASYLPGRQVGGVRVASDVVTIQVRSRWAVPIASVVAQIRGATHPLVGGHVVDVVIADISDAPQSTPALAAPVALVP
jgi:hypothetical protein